MKNFLFKAFPEAIGRIGRIITVVVAVISYAYLLAGLFFSIIL